ncbi:MAG: metallophosphatase domain-containing protein [Flammeovirgaceae bacterium]
MRFVAIADTHGEHRKLHLPVGDVLIHAGDFCHFGNEEHLHDFLEWFSGLSYQYKIFIGGNHDFFAAAEPLAFQRLIPEGVTYLNDSGITINGIKIWGSPVQPDLVGMAFGLPRGEHMKPHWEQIPQDVAILITHTPPYGILDQSSRGKELGCEELTKKLFLNPPKYHIFGHIHSAYGQITRGNTTYINASNMNSKNGLVNEPVVFEL